MKTKKIAIDAVLAAMCAVLGYVALDMGNIKITFESLPIPLGALFFGPVDGLAIGFVGTTIYQLVRYGVSVTTPLWIAPYALAGLFVGYTAKKKGFPLRQKDIVILTMSSELFITIFNTLTLYIDSKMFGYYFVGFIAGSLAVRLIICIGKAVAFSIVLPQLLDAVLRSGGDTV